LTLFAVWRARKAYLGELVDALRAGRPQVFYGEENPFGRFEHDAAAAEVAVAGLSDPNPAVRRAAAEVLGNLAVSETIQALIDALDDPDAGVRAALLQSLARTKAASALTDVAAFLTDPEPHVRVQAINAVRQLADDPEDVVSYVQALLEDPIPAVRSEAAVALLESEPHPRAVQVLHEMVTAEEVEDRVNGLDGFGAWGDATSYEPSAAALTDPQPVVRRAAASALAKVENPRCPEPLVLALGDSDRSVREAAAAALGAIGEPALQPAVRALCDRPLAEGALLALAQLPVSSEAEAIRAFAKQESASAVQYTELWGRVRSLAEQDDRTFLLAESLHSTAERHGANALRAISLLSDRDAISVAIDNLVGAQADQRANAVEILDSVADREIIRPILPLWESSADATASDEGRSSSDMPIEGWLIPVLRDPDPWLRACAALVAGGIEKSQIRTELNELAKTDPDSTVREAAATALNGGSPMQTLATLSSMERIMFLRRVPLFVDLPPAELQQVAAIAEEFLFVDGETISVQGDPGDEMYIIVSGEVSVVTGANGKDRIELARRKPGDYVGEMAIISRQPRMASLVAAGDVRTLCIGQKQFEGILRERPETSLAVMRVLCERLREREDHTNLLG
jgi:HEAT repeat protein